MECIFEKDIFMAKSKNLPQTTDSEYTEHPYMEPGELTFKYNVPKYQWAEVILKNDIVVCLYPHPPK